MKAEAIIVRVCAAIAGALLSFSVNAHSTSTAYLDVDARSPAEPALQWRIALCDLDALLNLDANVDDQLTWGEVTDRSAGITALASAKLALRSGAAPCALRFEALRFVRLADAGYAQLSGVATCSSAASALDYRLFEGIDPSHRVLVTVQGSTQPRIVVPGATIDVATAVATSDAPSGFGGFLSSGIGHIAGGIDHVLFLLTLLLPAVLVRRDGRWLARDSVQGALWTVVWIATAFTIAHSITLALATFDVIRIPSRVIEPLIALTILATALNNVWSLVTQRLAAVAFAFGLIHGFGFAEVLMPLELPRAELALALLGFNLGVELGQLGIVAVAFFALATLRRWPGYPRWIMTLGSTLIAGVAALWLIERVFDVSLLGL